jgi:hypothetical protein
MGRYESLIPAYEKRLRARLSNLDEDCRRIAVWAQAKTLDDTRKVFPNQHVIACGITTHTWNGYNVRPPMMVLGEEAALGVFGRERGKPKVSFSLKDKPFSGDTWFYNQHLVASVSMLGGLHDDEQHTFRPPYIPELNEFFSRTMHFDYEKLRVEPDRIGIIIDAADHDASLNARPVPALIEKLFALAGLRSQPSGGGLITQQLISRVGGVQGARVFKIPGVRRLLKTHGPNATFTKRAALQLIGAKDEKNPAAKFSDHQDLFIEPRPDGAKLTPSSVFAYLVEKGLFRIGAELKCPTCSLSSWTPLDRLQQKIGCELCGSEFDATRQLVEGQFHYRRTGVLGLEKNTQGAIPVALTLQQLAVNLRGLGRESIYAVSQDLEAPDRPNFGSSEIDFVLVLSPVYPRKTQIVFGECKDEGGTIDERDIENLIRVTDAFPRSRFEPFVVLAKLAPFTDKEILLAKKLNRTNEQRAILLTARELEPYRMYERTKRELGIDSSGGTPEELAKVTKKLYFSSGETILIILDKAR